MADTHEVHGHEDPNAAPMHPEIVEKFAPASVLFCYLLAAAALLGGLIAGLMIIND